MGGASERKGYEKGMAYEIKCVEEVIAYRKAHDMDCKYEKKLLSAWKKLSERDYGSPAIVDLTHVGYPKSAMPRGE